MSNKLIQNLGCADVYRTYVLLLTAEKNTLTTNTTIEQLAFFVDEKASNYKGGKSSKSFNDKLRETGEVTIQNKDSGRKDRTWTDYVFSPVTQNNYRRIGREFYDSHKTLDLKLKGFILKLFSAAEPHSHVIKLSVRKLEKLIHMGHSTIRTYINQLKTLNLLDEIDECIILKVSGLIIDQPRDKVTEQIIADFEHVIANNESKGHPLSRECLIYKKYKEKDFYGIKNMRAFMNSIRSGLVGRKRKPPKEELPPIIL